MSRLPQLKSSRSSDGLSRQLRSAMPVCKCLPFTNRGKTGNEWISKAFINFNADFTDTFVEFSDTQLVEQTAKLPADPVAKLFVFGYPLDELTGDILPALAYHAVLIIQMSNDAGYWCMEKDDRGLQISFSKKWDRILYKDGSGADRPKDIEEKIIDECSCNIQEIFAYLCESNQLSQPYHYIQSNCQHFAQDVFNFFASKRYEP